MLAGGDEEVLRVYDPRLTVIDGVVHICFAMDTRHGLVRRHRAHGGFFEIRYSSLSVPDNRNMVLFPEKNRGPIFPSRAAVPGGDKPWPRPVRYLVRMAAGFVALAATNCVAGRGGFLCERQDGTGRACR